MNKEEYITQFREQMLPKYIELAEFDPYVPEKIIKLHPIDVQKCSVCGELLALTAFNEDDYMCRRCKNNLKQKKRHKSS